MQRWLGVEAVLPTPHMRLPARSFENTAEVRCEENHPCKHSEDPEPLVSFSSLWSRSVGTRRQGLSLDFAHGRGNGG